MELPSFEFLNWNDFQSFNGYGGFWNSKALSEDASISLKEPWKHCLMLCLYFIFLLMKDKFH